MAEQMKNSKMTDQWIYDLYSKNPIAFIMDEKTGQPTANLFLGPVRLSFCDNLLQPGKKMKSDPNSGEGFSATVLFTPWSDMRLLRQEEARVVAGNDKLRGAASPKQGGGFFGIRDPLRDQAEKASKYTGYTPGCMFTTLSANNKPAVVDPRMNPIVDKTKVYPGVWAFVAANAYASVSSPANMGVRFGIQSVMIIGDDENLGGGGAPDPKAMFRGAQVAMPVSPPSAAFGQPVAPPPTGQAAIGAVYGNAPPPPPAAPLDPLAAFGVR